MTCCRCNRTGRCQNCACVKRGQPCQSCLPQRLGNCANTVQTQPSALHPALANTSTQPSSLTLNRGPESPLSSLLSTSDTFTIPHDLLLSSRPSSSVTTIPETPPRSSASENEPVLPRFTPMADPVFTWGEQDSTQFTDTLNAAYAEAVHWKMNLFKFPYGKAGRSFVSELARLFKAFATSSALESVALRAATLMPILLLQKPARKSKVKDHITCLERRLKTWQEGELNELLREGRTIQQRISNASPAFNNDKISRSFAKMMFQGKTKAALRLLSEQNKGGVLHLDDPIETENGQRKVRDILLEKHPPCEPVHHDAIINDDPPDVHPQISGCCYDYITFSI